MEPDGSWQEKQRYWQNESRYAQNASDAERRRQNKSNGTNGGCLPFILFVLFLTGIVLEVVIGK